MTYGKIRRGPTLSIYKWPKALGHNSICFLSHIPLTYFSAMNHFHLSLFIAFLLVFTPMTVQAARHSFPRLSFASQQVFRPPEEAPIHGHASEYFKSEKRRVPTGSNPLHNKRQYRSFRRFFLSFHMIICYRL